MSATEEYSRSNSKSEKNTSADDSNDNVRTPNSLPKHVHLHEEDAVECYVDSEEGDDDLSSDSMHRHIQRVGTL